MRGVLTLNSVRYLCVCPVMAPVIRSSLMYASMVSLYSKVGFSLSLV
jgi:hypothetical protein